MHRELQEGEVILHLIGGSHSGERHHFDLSKGQYLALMNERLISFSDEIREINKVPEYDNYRVERLFYPTGHRHYFGVHSTMRLVDAMNCMWDQFSKVERQRTAKEK